MSLGVTKECFPPANECHNCTMKHRDGITEESEQKKEFKRCAGCHLLTYCDKDCQLEHWQKVHKHHCKYLSGRKQVANSQHKKDSCPLCIAEKKTSDSELTSPNSPKTICHIQVVTYFMKKELGEFFDFHKEGRRCECDEEFSCELPFSMGELSGQYAGMGVEEMVAHAQKLVMALNIKLQDRLLTNLTDDISYSLHSFRSILWSNLLVRGVLESHDSSFQFLVDLTSDLKVFFGPHNAWWKAIKISIDVIGRMDKRMALDYIDASNLDSPRFSNVKQLYDHSQSELKNIMFVTENNLWPKFKFWPTLTGTSLVLLLPDGTSCQTCGKELTGQVRVTKEEDKMHPVFLHGVGENGQVTAFCPMDRSPRCLMIYKSKQLKGVDDDDFKKEWDTLYSESRECDLCFKSSLLTHRCSECKAAQYCSTLCQGKDLSFHRTVCSNWAKDPSRKIISGKKQKNIHKAELV